MEIYLAKKKIVTHSRSCMLTFIGNKAQAKVHIANCGVTQTAKRKTDLGYGRRKGYTRSCMKQKTSLPDYLG